MDEQTKLIVSQVASEAADKAVAQALTSLGVDANDPFSVQKDMQALREMRSLMTSEEFKADLMHLRKWRLAMDGVRNKGILTVVGLSLTGIGAVFVVGFQAMWKGN